MDQERLRKGIQDENEINNIKQKDRKKEMKKQKGKRDCKSKNG